MVNELNVRGLALLTSSGADELSQEARSLAGPVFTHHWVLIQLMHKPLVP